MWICVYAWVRRAKILSQGILVICTWSKPSCFFCPIESQQSQAVATLCTWWTSATVCPACFWWSILEREGASWPHGIHVSCCYFLLMTQRWDWICYQSVVFTPISTFWWEVMGLTCGDASKGQVHLWLPRTLSMGGGGIQWLPLQLASVLAIPAISFLCSFPSSSCQSAGEGPLTSPLSRGNCFFHPRCSCVSQELLLW